MMKGEYLRAMLDINSKRSILKLGRRGEVSQEAITVIQGKVY